MSTSSPTLAIFCKVVDNFGDIGICWRLARQLHAEHGIDVTLWVDDLNSFRRIWPSVDADAAVQQVEGVRVRHWANQDGVFLPSDVADIVIEFWQAVQSQMPEPFETPEDYILHGSLGVNVMHGVLASLLGYMHRG